MYSAIVCRVSTRPHPNADRLQLGTAHGFQVVLSKDVVDGTLGVYFPCDGQISEQFAEANDLVGYTDPETGEKRGGFFPPNRRVKSQRFRGEKSEGYWTPLTSFDFTGYDTSKLTEGATFDELNGVPICNKYYTPATLKAMKNRGKIMRVNKCFPKHVETEKFQYASGSIPAGSILHFTEKLHGTSGRFGFVLDEKEFKPKWHQVRLKRAIKKGKVTAKYTQWEHLIGTRNIILGKHQGPSWYGSEEFRYKAVERLIGNLHKGEMIYFELVGYTTEEAPIMSPQSTSELSDVAKEYGKQMLYKYGCIPGQCAMYVYRMTQVNEDGHAVELSWPQVKARCAELGLMVVPELAPMSHYQGTYALEALRGLVDGLMEGPSTLDSSHIREGVVVRVDKPNGETDFLKAKSFTFGILEGYLKSSDDYVDAEEIS